MPARYRVGCDIGGTFTDFVLIDEATGAIRTAKRLTTPSDPSIAMLTGLAGLAENAPRYQGRTVRLAHATTLDCQRRHRAQGRPHRAAVHGGVPRRAGAAPLCAGHDLRDVRGPADAAGAAPVAPCGRRAHPRGRIDPEVSRSRRDRPHCRTAAAGGGRVRRDLLPAFLHEPGQRARRARPARRRPARRRDLVVVGRAAPDP